MKKNYIFTTLLVLVTSLQVLAQATVTPITANVLENPRGIALSGDFLYFSENIGNISRINVVNPAAPTPVVTGLSSPIDILIQGNDLYFTQANNGRISKIDITALDPVVEDVVTGLNSPQGLTISGNDLYYSEFSAQKISKIDITTPNPTPVTIIDDGNLNGPIGMLVDGNTMYICEFTDDKISKIDLSLPVPIAVDVVAGVDAPVSLLLIENELFIVEFHGNKISKIDITSPTPTVTNVVSGLQFPFGLRLVGDDLYVSQSGSSNQNISKISNAVILSVTEVQGTINDLRVSVIDKKLYTNKSNLKIQVYTVLGQEIKNENLAGIYIARFTDTNGNIQVKKILVK